MTGLYRNGLFLLISFHLIIVSFSFKKCLKTVVDDVLCELNLFFMVN